jgi:hypothetical protein
MVRSPPDAASRPDLTSLQRGAVLVDRLLRTFGPAAERHLGGACAQGLLFAIETAVHPRLAPHTLPPIRAACIALEAVLRRGRNWAAWDPTQPDVLQYITGGWANMSDFLPEVCNGRFNYKIALHAARQIHTIAGAAAPGPSCKGLRVASRQEWRIPLTGCACG